MIGANVYSFLFFIAIGIFIGIFIIIFFLSIKIIGPAEVGLVMKRFGRKLSEDNPIAFNGEAGYQADLLMPGFRFKMWIFYRVTKFPWVQIPAGEIGVVIAQIGKTLPQGAKSATYKKDFGNFTDLKVFVTKGGGKGVQRPVLPPGSLLPIHPVAFLIISKNRVYGLPISPDFSEKGSRLTPKDFNLSVDQLNVVKIEPASRGEQGETDVIGVITTLEGNPLQAGHIASRLGGFKDIEELESGNAGIKAEESNPETTEGASIAGTKTTGKTEAAGIEAGASTKIDNATLIEALLNDQNAGHQNFQDFQAFIDKGGEMGLQHDVLRYGAYTLNPFLVKVEIVPMLVVKQGETAVIKAYEGLPTRDTSGAEFKFGSLVKPGHHGLWEEPLRTGKYAINPRIYHAEIVPTCIIKLDWAEGITGAHNLDKDLKPIVAKSNEGFKFSIDLQVLIHVPDTKAPRVISMVGSMQNLVTEVLQAAVGNLFRDKLGSMPAIKFIETRQSVQEEAFAHIKDQLGSYDVETKGVYIQDVDLPQNLVDVLTKREIANQEIKTFEMEELAQDKRVDMEKAKGMADKQGELASSEVGITIKSNNAEARKKEADGEAYFISETGQAKAAEVKAVGLANAEAYQKQVQALGQMPTALVNVVGALSKSATPFMPNILVAGGGNGALEGLAASLMGLAGKYSSSMGSKQEESVPVPDGEKENQ